MIGADDRTRTRPPSRSLRVSSPTSLLVLAAVFWAGGGLIARGSPLTGPALAFWRSLLGAILYQGVLLTRGVRPSLASLRVAALGGIGFAASVVCLFIAYKSTTLLSANVIGSLQPILLGIVSHRFGGERVDRWGWAALLAAVFGTVVVVAGSSVHAGEWSLRGDLFALAGVVAGCLYPIGTKRARRSLGALEFQASALWISTVLTLPVALVVASSTSFVPPIDALPWVAGLVAVGGSGHLLFSSAQRHVSVAASSTIVLVEVVAVAIGGAVFFDQAVSGIQMLGTVIVGTSVAWWIAREPAIPDEI